MTPIVLLVIALRVAFGGFAIAGVALSVYVGRDAHQDLLARRRAGLNGSLELIGRIARTQSYEVALPLHLGFLILAALSAFAPITATAAGVRTIVAYLVFIVIQALVIRGQARVVWWRRRVRSVSEESP
jgi:hypothetical protein